MKPNYFTIHKNKKPKSIYRLNKGYRSSAVPLACMISAIGASQVNMMLSQPTVSTSKEDKENAIFESLFSASKGIIKSFEQEHTERFKATGKYGRKIKNIKPC